MTTPLVVLGSINLDYTVVVDHWPAPGETVLATTLATSIGGKGANQAVAKSAIQPAVTLRFGSANGVKAAGSVGDVTPSG